MEFYEYPDCKVFDEVVSGIGLAGAVPNVPSFEPCFKTSKTTVADLARSAPASRSAMLQSIRSSGDDEIYRTDAVISRRFGIRQSSGESTKIRLVDDFHASGVNDTVQVETAPKLHMLDVAAALCSELLGIPGSHVWLGKTIDSSSAYRQLGVALEASDTPVP